MENKAVSRKALSGGRLAQTGLCHLPSTSLTEWSTMPRAIVDTRAKSSSGSPLTRLRPRKTHPTDVQAQAPPRKPLTVAEQERLLRIGLPIEMWKEVIHHAASVEHEFETCGFEGSNYTFDHEASYKAEWYKTFQTRLSLVLVCKSWNNLASEYLYRSILVTHTYPACEFVRFVLRLVNNGMVKHVRRVSVYSFRGSNAPKSSLRNAIAQFPNLRVLDIHTYILFRPEVNQTHITTLCASFKEWSAFETLALLPHLQHLRFSLYGQPAISSKVKLSRLKTLHVGSYRPQCPFYEWLDLPNLLTLILHDFYATRQLPLIQHFLPHIHALGFHSFTVQLPPSNPSAPHLTSLICRQPLGMSWRDIPHILPSKAIEEVHLSLEAAMLERSLPRVRYLSDDHSLASMLLIMSDKVVMPKLSYVYTDLTTNTLRILKGNLKHLLRNWLTSMQKRGVNVITYIKTSRYADHRYCSLEEVWNAEPHWGFWEPSRALDEMIKWDLLAIATGRKNMTWRVTKDGSECQWFEEAQKE